jgi:hypothetical protein
MNIKKMFLPLIIGTTIIFSGCGNNEIKKDAIEIGDAMCRNIEIMNKLRAIDPKDSVTSQKLHSEAKKLQVEMTILYKEFGDKYGEKTKKADFNKKFAQELRRAMLDCPYLSKEDRAQFEKELKE